MYYLKASATKIDSFDEVCKLLGWVNIRIAAGILPDVQQPVHRMTTVQFVHKRKIVMKMTETQTKSGLNPKKGILLF